MTTKRASEPVNLAVSMALAKETLRIAPSDTSLDATIELVLKGIIRQTEHELNRSLISQGWTLTLDSFPDALRLDNPPLISVQSISYYDEDDALQTLDPADYYVDAVTEPGYVVPGSGKAWPSTFSRVNALTVNYTAGYGTTHESVPANIRGYILVRLQEQFDPTGREFKETAQSKYAARLLDEARVYV